MKILIVDDSKAIFLMVSAMLEDAGHESLWAENGQKAIDAIAEQKVDLILLDWNMPVMNGPEFLGKVKADNLTDAPVVMMTTENKPDYIMKALELGASEYVMKPFTSDILINKIDLVLGGF